MFERFTERARQVVVLAQEQAREADRDRIDSVALLLGLLAEGEGLACRVLTSLKVGADEVRKAWTPDGGHEQVPPAEEREDSQRLPFTDEARAILEAALREALSLGHNYIGTEHILLGLVRREDSDAAMMLHDSFGVNAEGARQEVLRMFGGARRPSPPQRRAMHEVQPWALDVAQGLIRVVKDANYTGKATFEHGHVTIEVDRNGNGMSTKFWTTEAA